MRDLDGREAKGDDQTGSESETRAEDKMNETEMKLKPETDAHSIWAGPGEVIPAYLCRKLERERIIGGGRVLVLNDLAKKRKKLEKGLASFQVRAHIAFVEGKQPKTNPIIR